MTTTNEKEVLKSDSFVFYRSFLDSIEELNDEEIKNECYKGLILFGLNGELPELKSEVSRALVKAFATQIGSQKRKRASKKTKKDTEKNEKDARNDTKKTQKSELKTQKSENKSAKKTQMDSPNNNNNNNNNSNNNNKSKNNNKNVFGKFSNVRLSFSDVRDLKKEFPNDYKQRIEQLSNYKKSSGKTYADDAATIRLWAARELEEVRKRQKEKDLQKLATMSKEEIADTKKREKMLDESLAADVEAVWADLEKEQKNDE